MARRYARALFNAAVQQQMVEEVGNSFRELLHTLEEQPALRQLLLNPLMARERKQQLVQQALAGKVHPLLVSLLNVMIRKRRENVLEEVFHEYGKLYDEHLGILRVQAISARPIDELQERALVRSLEQRTGKTVVLDKQVDPSLIGGIVVRIGDTVIDGSVHGQLQRLRHYLLNA
ncbi:MAG: ATP synthase F1 subunit delta [bacterium]|nr:ATP synthase F1 subunit delta [bacterium]MCS7309884.1 ATP synthase F1 subunit delta [Armatimonadota bacterium]